ncbi:MAG: hypothetical protein C4532_01045 [Candidatus Abyssobacteria bacterium SURF_17]|uniref:Uncharacterized protein n=1 Tax=Candidatus Abyssobacteria bacterium SURF_17 TaxID=2093361 RepID=A0A419F978_9BACT|nr:MAG: hypothetical protein C4532_01045 [Candidatus Abyssubacteria bacterium SURF_17]
MAYDYKPGEDDDILKRYALVATVVVVLAILVVLTLYLGLGIDTNTLKIMLKRVIPDPTNVIFIIIFLMAAFALWGFFREPAAAENVQRRQTYLILLLFVAGIMLAGTIYFKYFSRPTHEVTKMEICPRCGGTGRAKYRPEYPCGYCDGTGHVAP